MCDNLFFLSSCVSALQCTAIYSCSPLRAVLTSTPADSEGDAVTLLGHHQAQVNQSEKCHVVSLYQPIWTPHVVTCGRRPLNLNAINWRCQNEAPRWELICMLTQVKNRLLEELSESDTVDSLIERCERVAANQTNPDKLIKKCTNYMKPRSITLSKAACDTNID